MKLTILIIIASMYSLLAGCTNSTQPRSIYVSEQSCVIRDVNITEVQFGQHNLMKDYKDWPILMNTSYPLLHAPDALIELANREANPDIMNLNNYRIAIFPSSDKNSTYILYNSSLKILVVLYEMDE